MEYLEGKGGRHYLSNKYGLGSKTILYTWINAYQKYGNEGLSRSRKKDVYSFDFKNRMVELYLTSEVSYQDLAFSHGMKNPMLICKWVNDFRIAGPDALRPKKKGRKKSMNSNNKGKKRQALAESTPVNISAEHVKQLEDEVLKLRIENAYLKELRRLRLEEEALLKKQRELSAASEENSN